MGSVHRIVARSRWHALVVALLGLGAGGALIWYTQVVLSREGDDDRLPYNRTWGGVAAFVGAGDMAALVEQADLVAKVVSAGHGLDTGDLDVGLEKPIPDYWIVSEVRVLEVFKGVPHSETITIGNPVGICLEKGVEYYVFLGEDRTADGRYIDEASLARNPARYGFKWFGPQNVFQIENGRVAVPVNSSQGLRDLYDGMTEAAFADQVRVVIGGTAR